MGKRNNTKIKFGNMISFGKYTKIIIAFILAALVFGSVYLFIKAYPNLRRSQAAYDDFLHVSGRNLVYRGQTVFLRGAHVNNAPWNFNFAGSIMTSEADYAKLASMNGNHFRWGINYEAWANNRTQFYQLLDQQVQWARKYNVWLVFVAHTVPGPCMPSGWQECGMNSASNQNALIAMWVDIAAHYANEPAVAGYDLINEPGLSLNTIYDIHQRARDQMQAVDPNDHLIFVTSDAGGQHNRKLNGDNFVYQAHDYIPLQFSHCGDGNYGQPPVMTSRTYPGNATEWDGKQYYYSKETMSAGNGAMQDIQLRNSITWARNNNVPIYLGEWGAESCFTGQVQYMQDHSDLYRQWGVNHAVHHWVGTKGRWSIFPGSGNFTPWDQGLYNAIASGWVGNVRPNFGGGPVVTPPPVTTPPPSGSAPAVNLAINGGVSATIPVGSTFNLTWSSSNATTCTSNWNPTITPNVSGSLVSGATLVDTTLWLECTNSAGSTRKYATAFITSAGTPVPSTAPGPYKTLTIPGTIQAEDFDNGGQNVSYSDTTSGNTGGAYRQTDVDIKTVTAGTIVGWMPQGEWLSYTVNISQSGLYRIDARGGTTFSGKQMGVEIGGTQVATLNIPQTADWETYQDFTVGTINLTAGTKKMILRATTDSQDIDWIKFTLLSSGSTSTPSPTPVATPVRTLSPTPRPTSAVTPTPVPTTPPVGGQPGWFAEYYNGANFENKVLTRVDNAINFDWGEGSPASGVNSENFSVRWTAVFVPPVSGSYTFNSYTDDGGRVWVANNMIIDNWRQQAETKSSGAIVLQAGQAVTVVMEYNDVYQVAKAKLTVNFPAGQSYSVPN